MCESAQVSRGKDTGLLGLSKQRVRQIEKKALMKVEIDKAKRWESAISQPGCEIPESDVRAWTQ